MELAVVAGEVAAGELGEHDFDMGLTAGSCGSLVVIVVA